ncbi:calcineurin-like phosphoesterase C-terminal domain-containing protein [Hymenobacter sp. BT507]|uniref:Calcineurin-like phosphoesterase C-terminal domain-containing protein n=1 Tax=Hymenobacter citatus TaxID=2763506 RepID=A0ABR7MJ40_9BACT|nr:calcineurin-like phosphoesterase family protein [Hymenobacter citatus]MBC6611104.1 calcineurin-like phosphoesterase C-terminal domain-containing protein [Hymenobacter citatus]
MFRRKFLQSLGLLSAGVSLPLAPAAVAELAEPKAAPHKLDLAPLTIKGRVHTSGKGLAGVPVTDGYNIVLTDQSGRYTLTSNSTTEFVYLTLPRGYQIPQEKGVARFYQPIKPGQKSMTADFALQKLPGDDTKHTFMVWADPQMIDKKDTHELITVSAPDLKALAAEYNSPNTFAIGCGDLVWDHFELFEDYKQAVDITGIPFFQVIGNHDMNIKARSDDGSAETFKSLFGPTYYSFNRGEVHYVVLDNVFFIGPPKKYIGYLTETQLQWLEQDLSHVKPGSTVVVALHIPVDSGDKRRNQLKDESLGGVVANRHELYRLLKPYTAHIMSGHTHVCEKIFHENTIEHTHGAVCGAWWTGPICTDGTPSGYGVYEVDGPNIKWYYKSFGKDRNHQFRSYPKGANPDRPDDFVVNVWNWDPEWQVVWFENGQRQGPMHQQTSLDPMAVQLQAGDKRPAKHKWVDPTLTDHLFYARPSKDAKEIRVEVTDRFGQQYTETVAV